jgi:Mrp family chromosome partitioning ATPase
MSESISVLVSEQATVSGTAGNGSGRIYWVGGGKGGVGKSMMTLATVDHLLEQGANVLLVECDTSNPDVWKAYKEEVETELIDLDEADGWIHLVNTCVAAIASWSSTRRCAITSPSGTTEVRLIAAWRSSGASSLHSG